MMNFVRRRRGGGPAALALALCAFASGASAQAGGETAFLFLIGTDTAGIERFTAAPQQVVGEIQLQGQPRVSYMATREGAGRIGELYIVAYPPNSGPDAEPLQRARLRLAGDTGIAELTSGGSTTTQRLPTQPGALLMVNSSIALMEVALERLGEDGDSVTFPVLLAGGGQTLQTTIRRVAADSLVVRMGPQEAHLRVRDGALLRMSVPAQRLTAERVEGEAARALALGKPDYSAPEDAPYRADHVTIPTPAGHTLAGTLTIPEGAETRSPAVVTISGSGPQDRDEYIPLVPGYRPFRQVADTLGRRGIAVLRLDDRGTGESTGDFGRATSADFADDVRAAVAWLRARPDIDPEHIALLGHSEGGLIAPIVAATDDRLAGIVLLAGPSKTGREIIDFQLRYSVDNDTTIPAADRDSVSAARIASFDTASAAQPWMQYFLPYDPLPTIRRVRVPVLILNGATDQQVTADQAEALGGALRQAGNTDVTVRVYPDLNHLFLPDPVGNPAGYVRLTSGRIGPEVMGVIADWLVQRVR